MKHITKIKAIFAILLLYIIIVPPLYAQSISVRSLPGYVKAINQFNQLNPQEKVYLHFDNTGYYLGDTIWFKAYVVFAEQLLWNIVAGIGQDGNGIRFHHLYSLLFGMRD